MANVTVVPQRQVTVVTTRGETKVLTYVGVEWAGLKSLLISEGYSLGNMKAVEGVKRTTLEHPRAVVPEKDFQLFLMPYRSKSGAKAIKKAAKKAVKAVKKAAKKAALTPKANAKAIVKAKAPKKAAPKKAAKAVAKPVPKKKGKVAKPLVVKGADLEAINAPQKTDLEYRREMEELAKGFDDINLYR